jgi:hypothetical protein
VTAPPLPDAIATLLREAAAGHAQAFASTQGYDPEWPRWYADYLVAPLGRLLGRDLELEQLAADLAALDADQRQNAPGADWPGYYAAWFAQRGGA